MFQRVLNCLSSLFDRAWQVTDIHQTILRQMRYNTSLRLWSFHLQYFSFCQSCFSLCYIIDEFNTDPCNNVNIISFRNNVDGFNIDIVGIIGSDGDCEVSVSLTDCAESEHHIENNTQAKNEIGAATIDVPDATFYGDDVTVTVQSCLACEPLKYYLPNVTLTGLPRSVSEYVPLQQSLFFL